MIRSPDLKSRCILRYIFWHFMTYLPVSGGFSVFKYLNRVKEFISASATGKPPGTRQLEQNFLSEKSSSSGGWRWRCVCVAGGLGGVWSQLHKSWRSLQTLSSSAWGHFHPPRCSLQAASWSVGMCVSVCVSVCACACMCVCVCVCVGFNQAPNFLAWNFISSFWV